MGSKMVKIEEQKEVWEGIESDNLICVYEMSLHNPVSCEIIIFKQNMFKMVLNKNENFWTRKQNLIKIVNDSEF